MSIVDELRSLDTSDPGRWPLPIRAGAVAIVFAAAVAMGIWILVINQEMPGLRAAERQEVDLRTQFEDRQRKMALVKPSHRILALLKITKLDTVFKIFDSRESAMAYLNDTAA